MDVRLPHSQRPPEAVEDRRLSARRAAQPRWRLIAGIAAALVVALLVWWLWPRPAPQPTVQPAPVRVGVAQTRNVTVQEHTLGTIVANATVNVTARVEGQLIAAHFKEGDIVHQGDLLFQLDPRPLQAALAEAVASQNRDQASLVSARNDAVRYATLAAMGAASKSQSDQFVSQANALAATVAADRANVQTARLNLIYAQIRSPVNGKTGPILIQPGNIVPASGTNPLVVITQVQPVKVSFYLPQSDLPRIQAQMRAHRVFAIIQVHGQGGHTLTAPVDFVGNAVDNKTGTVELRATFPNLDYTLVPGQLVDTSVTLNQLDNAVVVPHDAVNLGPNSSFVYVITPQRKADIRNVTVLYDDGTQAAIQGKVKAGDQVVTEGQIRLVQDTPVSIRKGAAPAAPQTPAAGGQ